MKKNFSLVSAEGGFTMIELILVVVAVGIMALFVQANYSQNSFTPYAAFLKVMGDIRYAQQMALTTGQNYGFNTLSDHSYEIYQGAPGSPILDPVNHAPFTYDLSTKFPNTTFGANNYKIQFGAGGVPTVGGNQNYTLQNGGVTVTFRVEANTGTVWRQ